MKHLVCLTLFVCLQIAAAPRRYSVSGTVTGTDTVTVRLSGKTTAATVTAANGSYSFANLSKGSYTVTPVKTGYTFSPASRSFSFSGSSTTVTGVNFTATANQPPPPAHSVTLSWTASTTSSIDGYRIYRSTTSGGPYSRIADAVSTTSYLDNNVSAGGTYFYVATAYNIDGESGYSGEASAVIPTP